MIADKTTNVDTYNGRTPSYPPLRTASARPHGGCQPSRVRFECALWRPPSGTGICRQRTQRMHSQPSRGMFSIGTCSPAIDNQVHVWYVDWETFLKILETWKPSLFYQKVKVMIHLVASNSFCNHSVPTPIPWQSGSVVLWNIPYLEGSQHSFSH